ncbi:MAG: 6-carboxytetrahydropterin synthase [Thermodesulfobacteriota bacterium]
MKITENYCITRKFRFSASHRLYIKHLSQEQNFNIFERCSNIQGHGHDYTVEVRVKKNIDDETAMVINHGNFNLIGIGIIEKLNFKWIDKDIKYFENIQSTVENIGIYFWNQFKNAFGESLKYIKVWENKGSFFEYFEEKQR